MGIFTRSASELRARLETTSPRNPAHWLVNMLGADTAAGIQVGEREALSEAGLYSGIRIISEDVAAFPLPVYERAPNESRVLARTHPAWPILNDAFNPEMSAMTGREVLQGHALLRGNGFAEKEKAGGVTRALWPIPPHRVRIERNGRNGLRVEGAPADALFYIITLPSGEPKVLAADMVFNLRGFGGDGLRGYSLLRLAAEDIGLARAATIYGGAFFGNDATPGGYISHPGVLGDEGLDNLEASWNDAHRGLDNAHRIAILEEGMKFESIGLSPEDSQVLATRQFMVRTFARWLRLPPTMLADLADAPYANAEHLGLDYVKFTLRAWLHRWEQQLQLDLIGSPRYYAEHIVDDLLRASAKERSEFIQRMVQAGAMTPAMAAKKENLPAPTDALADQRLVPVNMLPASAYDAMGMTQRDRVNMVGMLVRAGFDPAGTLAHFGMDAIPHKGLVPITVQVDPAKVLELEQQQAAAAASQDQE